MGYREGERGRPDLSVRKAMTRGAEAGVGGTKAYLQNKPALRQEGVILVPDEGSKRFFENLQISGIALQKKTLVFDKSGHFRLKVGILPNNFLPNHYSRY